MLEVELAAHEARTEKVVQPAQGAVLEFGLAANESEVGALEFEVEGVELFAKVALSALQVEMSVVVEEYVIEDESFLLAAFAYGRLDERKVEK